MPRRNVFAKYPLDVQVEDFQQNKINDNDTVIETIFVNGTQENEERGEKDYHDDNIFKINNSFTERLPKTRKTFLEKTLPEISLISEKKSSDNNEISAKVDNSLVDMDAIRAHNLISEEGIEEPRFFSSKMKNEYHPSIGRKQKRHISRGRKKFNKRRKSRKRLNTTTEISISFPSLNETYERLKKIDSIINGTDIERNEGSRTFKSSTSVDQTINENSKESFGISKSSPHQTINEDSEEGSASDESSTHQATTKFKQSSHEDSDEESKASKSSTIELEDSDEGSGNFKSSTLLHQINHEDLDESSGAFESSTQPHQKSSKHSESTSKILDMELEDIVENDKELDESFSLIEETTTLSTNPPNKSEQTSTNTGFTLPNIDNTSSSPDKFSFGKEKTVSPTENQMDIIKQLVTLTEYPQTKQKISKDQAYKRSQENMYYFNNKNNIMKNVDNNEQLHPVHHVRVEYEEAGSTEPVSSLYNSEYENSDDEDYIDIQLPFEKNHRKYTKKFVEKREPVTETETSNEKNKKLQSISKMKFDRRFNRRRLFATSTAFWKAFKWPEFEESFDSIIRDSDKLLQNNVTSTKPSTETDFLMSVRYNTFGGNIGGKNETTFETKKENGVNIIGNVNPYLEMTNSSTFEESESRKQFQSNLVNINETNAVNYSKTSYSATTEVPKLTGTSHFKPLEFSEFQFSGNKVETKTEVKSWKSSEEYTSKQTKSFLSFSWPEQIQYTTSSSDERNSGEIKQENKFEGSTTEKYTSEKLPTKTNEVLRHSTHKTINNYPLTARTRTRMQKMKEKAKFWKSFVWPNHQTYTTEKNINSSFEKVNTTRTLDQVTTSQKFNESIIKKEEHSTRIIEGTNYSPELTGRSYSTDKLEQEGSAPPTEEGKNDILTSPSSEIRKNFKKTFSFHLKGRNNKTSGSDRKYFELPFQWPSNEVFEYDANMALTRSSTSEFPNIEKLFTTSTRKPKSGKSTLNFWGQFQWPEHDIEQQKGTSIPNSEKMSSEEWPFSLDQDLKQILEETKKRTLPHVETKYPSKFTLSPTKSTTKGERIELVEDIADFKNFSGQKEDIINKGPKKVSAKHKTNVQVTESEDDEGLWNFRILEPEVVIKHHKITRKPFFKTPTIYSFKPVETPIDEWLEFNEDLQERTVTVSEPTVPKRTKPTFFIWMTEPRTWTESTEFSEDMYEEYLTLTPPTSALEKTTEIFNVETTLKSSSSTEYAITERMTTQKPIFSSEIYDLSQMKETTLKFNVPSFIEHFIKKFTVMRSESVESSQTPQISEEAEKEKLYSTQTIFESIVPSEIASEKIEDQRGSQRSFGQTIVYEISSTPVTPTGSNSQISGEITESSSTYQTVESDIKKIQDFLNHDQMSEKFKSEEENLGETSATWSFETNYPEYSRGQLDENYMKDIEESEEYEVNQKFLPQKSYQSTEESVLLAEPHSTLVEEMQISRKPVTSLESEMGTTVQYLQELEEFDNHLKTAKTEKFFDEGKVTKEPYKEFSETEHVEEPAELTLLEEYDHVKYETNEGITPGGIISTNEQESEILDELLTEINDEFNHRQHTTKISSRIRPTSRESMDKWKDDMNLSGSYEEISGEKYPTEPIRTTAKQKFFHPKVINFPNETHEASTTRGEQLENELNHNLLRITQKKTEEKLEEDMQIKEEYDSNMHHLPEYLLQESSTICQICDEELPHEADLQIEATLKVPKLTSPKYRLIPVNYIQNGKEINRPVPTKKGNILIFNQKPTTVSSSTILTEPNVQFSEEGSTTTSIQEVTLEKILAKAEETERATSLKEYLTSSPTLFTGMKSVSIAKENDKFLTKHGEDKILDMVEYEKQTTPVSNKNISINKEESETFITEYYPTEKPKYKADIESNKEEKTLSTTEYIRTENLLTYAEDFIGRETPQIDQGMPLKTEMTSNGILMENTEALEQSVRPQSGTLMQTTTNYEFTFPTVSEDNVHTKNGTYYSTKLNKNQMTTINLNALEHSVIPIFDLISKSTESEMEDKEKHLPRTEKITQVENVYNSIMRTEPTEFSWYYTTEKFGMTKEAYENNMLHLPGNKQKETSTLCEICDSQTEYAIGKHVSSSNTNKSTTTYETTKMEFEIDKTTSGPYDFEGIEIDRPLPTETLTILPFKMNSATYSELQELSTSSKKKYYPGESSNANQEFITTTERNTAFIKSFSNEVNAEEFITTTKQNIFSMEKLSNEASQKFTTLANENTAVVERFSSAKVSQNIFNTAEINTASTEAFLHGGNLQKLFSLQKENASSIEKFPYGSKPQELVTTQKENTFSLETFSNEKILPEFSTPSERNTSTFANEYSSQEFIGTEEIKSPDIFSSKKILQELITVAEENTASKEIFPHTKNPQELITTKKETAASSETYSKGEIFPKLITFPDEYTASSANEFSLKELIKTAEINTASVESISSKNTEELITKEKKYTASIEILQHEKDLKELITTKEGNTASLETFSKEEIFQELITNPEVNISSSANEYSLKEFVSTTEMNTASVETIASGKNTQELLTIEKENTASTETYPPEKNLQEIFITREGNTASVETFSRETIPLKFITTLLENTVSIVDEYNLKELNNTAEMNTESVSSKNSKELINIEKINTLSTHIFPHEKNLQELITTKEGNTASLKTFSKEKITQEFITTPKENTAFIVNEYSLKELNNTTKLNNASVGLVSGKTTKQLITIEKEHTASIDIFPHENNLQQLITTREGNTASLETFPKEKISHEFITTPEKTNAFIVNGYSRKELVETPEINTSSVESVSRKITEEPITIKEENTASIEIFPHEKNLQGLITTIKGNTTSLETIPKEKISQEFITTSEKNTASIVDGYNLKQLINTPEINVVSVESVSIHNTEKPITKEKENTASIEIFSHEKNLQGLITTREENTVSSETFSIEKIFQEFITTSEKNTESIVDEYNLKELANTPEINVASVGSLSSKNTEEPITKEKEDTASIEIFPHEKNQQQLITITGDNTASFKTFSKENISQEFISTPEESTASFVNAFSLKEFVNTTEIYTASVGTISSENNTQELITREMKNNASTEILPQDSITSKEESTVYPEYFPNEKILQNFSHLIETASMETFSSEKSPQEPSTTIEINTSFIEKFLIENFTKEFLITTHDHTVAIDIFSNENTFDELITTTKKPTSNTARFSKKNVSQEVTSTPKTNTATNKPFLKEKNTTEKISDEETLQEFNIASKINTTFTEKNSNEKTNTETIKKELYGTQPVRQSEKPIIFETGLNYENTVSTFATHPQNLIKTEKHLSTNKKTLNLISNDHIKSEISTRNLDKTKTSITYRSKKSTTANVEVQSLKSVSAREKWPNDMKDEYEMLNLPHVDQYETSTICETCSESEYVQISTPQLFAPKSRSSVTIQLIPEKTSERLNEHEFGEIMSTQHIEREEEYESNMLNLPKINEKETSTLCETCDEETQYERSDHISSIKIGFDAKLGTSRTGTSEMREVNTSPYGFSGIEINRPIPTQNLNIIPFQMRSSTISELSTVNTGLVFTPQKMSTNAEVITASIEALWKEEATPVSISEESNKAELGGQSKKPPYKIQEDINIKTSTFSTLNEKETKTKFYTKSKLPSTVNDKYIGSFVTENFETDTYLSMDISVRNEGNDEYEMLHLPQTDQHETSTLCETCSEVENTHKSKSKSFATQEASKSGPHLSTGVVSEPLNDNKISTEYADYVEESDMLKIPKSKKDDTSTLCEICDEETLYESVEHISSVKADFHSKLATSRTGTPEMGEVNTSPYGFSGIEINRPIPTQNLNIIPFKIHSSTISELSTVNTGLVFPPQKMSTNAEAITASTEALSKEEGTQVSISEESNEAELEGQSEKPVHTIQEDINIKISTSSTLNEEEMETEFHSKKKLPSTVNDKYVESFVTENLDTYSSKKTSLQNEGNDEYEMLHLPQMDQHETSTLCETCSEVENTQTSKSKLFATQKASKSGPHSSTGLVSEHVDEDKISTEYADYEEETNMLKIPESKKEDTSTLCEICDEETEYEGVEHISSVKTDFYLKLATSITGTPEIREVNTSPYGSSGIEMNRPIPTQNLNIIPFKMHSSTISESSTVTTGVVFSPQKMSTNAEAIAASTEALWKEEATPVSISEESKEAELEGQFESPAYTIQEDINIKISTSSTLNEEEMETDFHSRKKLPSTVNDKYVGSFVTENLDTGTYFSKETSTQNEGNDEYEMLHLPQMDQHETSTLCETCSEVENTQTSKSKSFTTQKASKSGPHLSTGVVSEPLNDKKISTEYADYVEETNMLKIPESKKEDTSTLCEICDEETGEYISTFKTVLDKDYNTSRYSEFMTVEQEAITSTDDIEKIIINRPIPTPTKNIMSFEVPSTMYDIFVNSEEAFLFQNFLTSTTDTGNLMEPLRLENVTSENVSELLQETEIINRSKQPYIGFTLLSPDLIEISTESNSYTQPSSEEIHDEINEDYLLTKLLDENEFSVMSLPSALNEFTSVFEVEQDETLFQNAKPEEVTSESVDEILNENELVNHSEQPYIGITIFPADLMEINSDLNSYTESSSAELKDESTADYLLTKLLDETEFPQITSPPLAEVEAPFEIEDAEKMLQTTSKYQFRNESLQDFQLDQYKTTTIPHHDHIRDTLHLLTTKNVSEMSTQSSDITTFQQLDKHKYTTKIHMGDERTKHRNTEFMSTSEQGTRKNLAVSSTTHSKKPETRQQSTYNFEGIKINRPVPTENTNIFIFKMLPSTSVEPRICKISEDEFPHEKFISSTQETALYSGTLKIEEPHETKISEIVTGLQTKNHQISSLSEQEYTTSRAISSENMLNYSEEYFLLSTGSKVHSEISETDVTMVNVQQDMKEQSSTLYFIKTSEDMSEGKEHVISDHKSSVIELTSEVVSLKEQEKILETEKEVSNKSETYVHLTIKSDEAVSTLSSLLEYHTSEMAKHEEHVTIGENFEGNISETPEAYTHSSVSEEEINIPSTLGVNETTKYEIEKQLVEEHLAAGTVLAEETTTEVVTLSDQLLIPNELNKKLESLDNVTIDEKFEVNTSEIPKAYTHSFVSKEEINIQSTLGVNETTEHEIEKQLFEEQLSAGTFLAEETTTEIVPLIDQLLIPNELNKKLESLDNVINEIITSTFPPVRNLITVEKEFQTINMETDILEKELKDLNHDFRKLLATTMPSEIMLEKLNEIMEPSTRHQLNIETEQNVHSSEYISYVPELFNESEESIKNKITEISEPGSTEALRVVVDKARNEFITESNDEMVEKLLVPLSSTENLTTTREIETTKYSPEINLATTIAKTEVPMKEHEFSSVSSNISEGFYNPNVILSKEDELLLTNFPEPNSAANFFGNIVESAANKIFTEKMVEQYESERKGSSSESQQITEIEGQLEQETLEKYTSPTETPMKEHETSLQPSKIFEELYTSSATSSEKEIFYIEDLTQSTSEESFSMTLIEEGNIKLATTTAPKEEDMTYFFGGVPTKTITNILEFFTPSSNTVGGLNYALTTSLEQKEPETEYLTKSNSEEGFLVTLIEEGNIKVAAETAIKEDDMKYFSEEVSGTTISNIMEQEISQRSSNTREALYYALTSSLEQKESETEYLTKSNSKESFMTTLIEEGAVEVATETTMKQEGITYSEEEFTEKTITKINDHEMSSNTLEEFHYPLTSTLENKESESEYLTKSESEESFLATLIEKGSVKVATQTTMKTEGTTYLSDKEVSGKIINDLNENKINSPSSNTQEGLYALNTSLEQKESQTEYVTKLNSEEIMLGTLFENETGSIFTEKTTEKYQKERMESFSGNHMGTEKTVETKQSPEQHVFSIKSSIMQYSKAIEVHSSTSSSGEEPLKTEYSTEINSGGILSTIRVETTELSMEKTITELDDNFVNDSEKSSSEGLYNVFSSEKLPAGNMSEASPEEVFFNTLFEEEMVNISTENKFFSVDTTAKQGITSTSSKIVGNFNNYSASSTEHEELQTKINSEESFLATLVESEVTKTLTENTMEKQDWHRKDSSSRSPAVERISGIPLLTTLLLSLVASSTQHPGTNQMSGHYEINAQANQTFPKCLVVFFTGENVSNSMISLNGTKWIPSQNEPFVAEESSTSLNANMSPISQLTESTNHEETSVTTESSEDDDGLSEETEISSTVEVTTEEITDTSNFIQGGCTEADFENNNNCFCMLDLTIDQIAGEFQTSNSSNLNRVECSKFLKVNTGLIIKDEKSPPKRKKRSYLYLRYHNRKKREIVEYNKLDEVLANELVPSNSGERMYSAVGASVSIPCVDKNEAVEREHFTRYVWTSVEDKVVPLSDRVRETTDGVLKISDVTVKDGGNYTCSVNRPFGTTDAEHKRFGHELMVMERPIFKVKTTIMYNTEEACSLKHGDIIHNHLPKLLEELLCGLHKRVCKVEMERPNCVAMEDNTYLSFKYEVALDALPSLIPSLTYDKCDFECQMKIYGTLVSLLVKNVETINFLNIISELKTSNHTFKPREVKFPTDRKTVEDTTLFPMLLIGCPPGFGIQQKTNKICVACPRNFYSADNSSSCVSCPFIHFQPHLGSTGCMECRTPFEDKSCVGMVLANRSFLIIYIGSSVAIIFLILLCVFCAQSVGTPAKKKKNNQTPKRRRIGRRDIEDPAEKTFLLKDTGSRKVVKGPKVPPPDF